MATHSSILTWKISWTERPGGGYSPWGCKESDTTEGAHTHTFILIELLTKIHSHNTILYASVCVSANK